MKRDESCDPQESYPCGLLRDVHQALRSMKDAREQHLKWRGSHRTWGLSREPPGQRKALCWAQASTRAPQRAGDQCFGIQRPY